MEFDPIEEVIAAYGRGEIVIITDDENRENEGDLIAAAAKTDAATVNFMLIHARGLFCVPLAPEIAARIGLAQPAGKHDPRCTCFTQSVDAVEGTTTGVSAFDRAMTVRKLMEENAALDDFYTPGHVFRSSPGPAACSNGPATPRRLSTSPGLRDSRPAACCARF